MPSQGASVGSLSIASVCRWLPTPDDASAGVFVLRRLESMAERADVRVLQPLPYFPVVKALPAWASEPERPVGRLTVRSVPMFYVPKLMKRLDARWLYRSISEVLRRWHSERALHVIDAHFGYPDGVGSWLAARVLKVPFFMTFRGLEADYADRPAIRRQLTGALRDAAGCICVSGVLRDLAVEYGANPEKVTVIHNAVDRSVFKPGSREQSREQLGLSPRSRLVVSVGHLLQVKGHDTLIRAFAALRQTMPDAELAIVGGTAHEPEYPELLRRLAREAGIGEVVRFVGSVPPHEVACWLRAADAFALASRREGCCNAILEALATGTPVVATPVGDNAHFVQHDRNGFLFPVGDSTALAEALAAALSRPWDRDAISAGLAVGDWARVGRQVLEFFEQRIQRPRLTERAEKAATIEA